MTIFVVAVLCLVFFGLGLALGMWCGIQRERADWNTAARAAVLDRGLTPEEVARRFEEERRVMDRLSIDPLAVKPPHLQELALPEAVPAHDAESMWADPVRGRA